MKYELDCEIKVAFYFTSIEMQIIGEAMGHPDFSLERSMDGFWGKYVRSYNRDQNYPLRVTFRQIDIILKGFEHFFRIYYKKSIDEMKFTVGNEVESLLYGAISKINLANDSIAPQLKVYSHDT